jgi:putative SOS response-associated peptidase YedK
MCGRFSLGASATTLASHFNVQETLEVAARHNVAPTQEILTVIQPAGATRQLSRMRWGLIPAWAKDPTIGGKLINARAETVATKPTFRRPLRERRCLIPTDGFYEWEAQGQRKRPWFIRRRDGRLFAFAGLWDHWSDPVGKPVESCTIITTTPNDLIQPFHHRMPVILASNDYDLWLDGGIQDVDCLLPLLAPYPPQEMTAYPVSPRVNNPANDSPACKAPEA